MSKIKEAMKHRALTSKCETPICGAMVTQIECKQFDITRCHWMCAKDLDIDSVQLDLFERPTDDELEQWYQDDKASRASMKELNVNMDREEWEGR